MSLEVQKKRSSDHENRDQNDRATKDYLKSPELAF